MLTNSAFKVQPEVVTTLSGVVPERGAFVYLLTDETVYVGDGTKWQSIPAIPYNDTFYVDLLGPLIGQRLDAAATRYSYNVFNGAIQFDANARYPNEIISIHSQLLHEWKVGTPADPHLHWKQQSANIPNWLLGWKVTENGKADTIETDFTNWNFEVIDAHAFTYTSGVLDQISSFPEIPLLTAGISDMIDLVLFRDTTNASGLFAGADPEPLATYATDLDCHIQIDTPGSDFEFVKF